MKKITYLLLLISFPTLAQVSIPDVNFETELIAQGIDTDGVVNGLISNADVLAKTGTLDVDSKMIADLTGIEAFANINRLYCENNNLTALDISALTGLTQLRAGNNNLSTLVVTTNTALTQLLFDNNNISTINVSNNTLLTKINAHNNALTSINLSSNTALEILRLQSNNLSDLDVSNNSSLTLFTCPSNPSLICIKVFDVAYAEANFTKPADATFSTSCTLNTSDFNLMQNISIYPNPTSSSVSISSSTKILSLELYNLLGKRILITKNSNKLDLSNLNSGVYLVKIQTEKGETTKKIIKN